MKARNRTIAAILVLALAPLAAVATPERCSVQLSLHLTPDAADPKDQGFLDALVADPQYTITRIRGTDTRTVVQLTGPASDRRCRRGIRRLGMSAFVLDIEVIPPAAR
jgi:hypothetical protein